MTLGEQEFTRPIRSLLSPNGEALRSMPLLPEGPAKGSRLATLRELGPEDLFAPSPILRQGFARCVQAGLFLYFSALDDSHTISQGVHTASGSFWHGIMHRQEGDWANAKYWFRRVGNHPVLDRLAADSSHGWDPFEFIDRCAAAADGAGTGHKLEQLQMREWLLLMRHCHRRALAARS